MQDFEREIVRRAEAAVDVYRRRRGEPDRGRQRAREALTAVRRRFVQAALYSDSRLRVHYISGARADQVVGYGLIWAECPPRRELCIRLDAGRGAIEWELAAPELRLAKSGRVTANHFDAEFLDELIFALLDQDGWERSQIPSVGTGSRERSTAD